MKNMKKIFALLIALIMVFSMSMTVFATSDGGGNEGNDTPTVTTGSITLKNATKGYAYSAYKILDATYKTTTAVDPETGDESSSTSVSYTTTTPNLFKGEGSPWTVATIADANGNYNVQLASGKTASDVNTWIKNNIANFTAIAPTTGADSNGLASAANLVWSGLDFGYYYITSGLGANVTVDSTTPDAEVYDKNDTTPVDPSKSIIAVDGVAQNKVTTANAHVGSKVKFQIDAKTNNWIDKDTIRTKWDVTDTPTNMTIDLNSVNVKVNGTAIAASAYTATLTGSTLKVEIPMTDSNGNSIYAANTLDEGNTVLGLIPIEITYEATIDAAAGAAPAKNQLPGDNPPPPNVINTYAFQVAKTDGSDPLPGAQFELWSKMSGETDTKLGFIDNGDGTYTYSPSGTVTTLDMTENTTIVIKGLDTAWSYTLKEITVPKGYNQAPDVTIAGSKLTKVEETVTQGDGTETTTQITDTSVESISLYKETVVNNAGTELPSTGGMGTTLFYVFGIILVLGGSIFLVSRRRMVK